MIHLQEEGKRGRRTCKGKLDEQRGVYVRVRVWVGECARGRECVRMWTDRVEAEAEFACLCWIKTFSSATKGPKAIKVIFLEGCRVKCLHSGGGREREGEEEGDRQTK